MLIKVVDIITLIRIGYFDVIKFTEPSFLITTIKGLIIINNIENMGG
jgi:hypothetical protein